MGIETDDLCTGWWCELFTGELRTLRGHRKKKREKNNWAMAHFKTQTFYKEVTQGEKLIITNKDIAYLLMYKIRIVHKLNYLIKI